MFLALDLLTYLPILLLVGLLFPTTRTPILVAIEWVVGLVSTPAKTWFDGKVGLAPIASPTLVNIASDVKADVEAVVAKVEPAKAAETGTPTTK